MKAFARQLYKITVSLSLATLLATGALACTSDTGISKQQLHEAFSNSNDPATSAWVAYLNDKFWDDLLCRLPGDLKLEELKSLADSPDLLHDTINSEKTTRNRDDALLL
ncbi:MAG: hypothetical protein AAF423_11780, partial [Pseudomonadota bacterium]